MTNCTSLYLDLINVKDGNNFYACVLKACLSLFVYDNTTVHVLELQTLLLFFFLKSEHPNWGCSLHVYLWMQLIHRNFFFSFSAITLKPRRKTWCTRHENINPPQHCCAKFRQGHNQKTIKKKTRRVLNAHLQMSNVQVM